MKQLQAIRIWAIVPALLLTMSISVCAQPSVPATKLDTATLASSPKTDAGDPVMAKAYTALSLYPVDKKKFLQALNSPALQNASLPPALREELDFKQIDALFFYRKFDEMLTKIAIFAQNHPDSTHLNAVTEYQMATLFARGMKQVTDAGLSDTNGFARHWTSGASNLVDFLTLAVTLDQTNYLILTNCELPEEIIQAMTALGNDQAIKLVPSAGRERAEFLSLKLYCQLQPQAADDNLRRMTNFLNEYPGTKYRKRVQYDMANVALAEGWRLGDGGRTPAVAADPYLKLARDLYQRVGLVEDSAAGIAAADVEQSQLSILRSYYTQNDFTNVALWAAQIITKFPAKGKEWLIIKLYDASRLAEQKQLVDANRELDEILATGFKGNPSYDGHLVSAARWRVSLAWRLGDLATAHGVAQMVADSACYDSLKRTFVKDYHGWITQTNLPAK